jgi:hypothetical protein
LPLLGLELPIDVPKLGRRWRLRNMRLDSKSALLFIKYFSIFPPIFPPISERYKRDIKKRTVECSVKGIGAENSVRLCGEGRRRERREPMRTRRSTIIVRNFVSRSEVSWRRRERCEWRNLGREEKVYLSLLRPCGLS